MSLGRIKRAIRLEMIELPPSDPRHKKAPYISPPIQIAIEFDYSTRLRIFDRIIKQNTHGSRVPAENGKLHSAVSKYRPVGQRDGKIRVFDAFRHNPMPKLY